LWAIPISTFAVEKDVYLLGTKDDLVAERSLSATHPYLGPSWSWIHFRHLEYPKLNIGGPSATSGWSFCNENDFRNECNVLDSSCTPASSSDPFGRLIDAELVIRGRKIHGPKASIIALAGHGRLAIANTSLCVRSIGGFRKGRER
jgi:hypothetical protein